MLNLRTYNGLSRIGSGGKAKGKRAKEKGKRAKLKVEYGFMSLRVNGFKCFRV